jgi:tetratricopeptide (TPR) repeat protein
MARMRAWIGAVGGVVVVPALVACGGSKPPAQTSGAPAAAAASASPAVQPASEPEQAAPEGPPSPEVAAGLQAFDAGNYADARRSFEAATQKNPKDYGAFVDLGQTCEKLGDKAAAEAAYKSALAIEPDLVPATAELASLYAQDGRVDDALALARTALARHPGSAPLHESLGIALASRGDQQGATAEFEQAIKLAPSDPMLHYTFASWLNAWHVRGAAPHLDAALSLIKPDDYAMIVSIGDAYRLAGEPDQCVKTLDRALRMKDRAEPRTYRALCKLALKDEPGTVADLQAAVAKEPSYAPAHYYLAGRLAIAKHFQQAAAEYAKYLELEPSGPLAAQASARLKMAQDAAAQSGGKAPKGSKKTK